MVANTLSVCGEFVDLADVDLGAPIVGWRNEMIEGRGVTQRTQFGDEAFSRVLRRCKDKNGRTPGALTDAKVPHIANLLNQAGEQGAVEGAALAAGKAFAGKAAVFV